MFIRFTSLFITIIFLTTFSHIALADSYLDALATEAESTANVSSSNQLDAVEQKEFRKMEEFLETERPSTYTFYKKLYPKNKERVFKFFASDQSDPNDRLSHLQKKVMDLYFNQ